MSVNSGKIFEQDIKYSIPEYCLTIRLPDPPHSFEKRSDTKFAHKNPCDYIVFDSQNKKLYCLELKTTKYKSMSFEDIDSNEKQNKMIHKHQIEGLLKFSKFDNVESGFLFNFRDEKNNVERTYYQDIDSFRNMCLKINKSSFNEMDLILYDAIKINGKKKRTRYIWDIDGLLRVNCLN